MGREMTFGEATDYLYSLRGRGAKLGLGRVERLLAKLGNPEQRFRPVLVGGTSGKGSTAAMIASILSEAGHRTGRFTSPHLSRLTERVVVDGEEISESGFVRVLGKVRDAIEAMGGEGELEHPTFFEVMAAAAFLHFADVKVDFAVLEVGLGGRLDATNTAPAEVSVVTNVSLEHTAILGDTVEKIAREKGGIIKNGGMLITAASGSALAVLEGICAERGAEMAVVGNGIMCEVRTPCAGGQRVTVSAGGKTYDAELPLLGRHQALNAACAIGAVRALSARGADVTDEAVVRGLERVRWPARMEIVRQEPAVILDCAKDPASMAALATAVEECFGGRNAVVVLGMSSDKDIRAMCGAVMPLAGTVVATKHDVAERAADPALIAAEARRHGKPCEVVPDTRDAVGRAVALAGKNGLVLVAGSVFLAGAVRELWKNGKGRWGRALNETPRK